MSAFAIWALCLTIVAVIYFAVLIALDLFSKPKDTKEKAEEFNNIGDVDSEEATAIEEDEMEPDNVPTLDNQFLANNEVPTGIDVPHFITGGNDHDSDHDSDHNGDTLGPSEMYNKLKDIQENNLESVYPEYQELLDSTSFMSEMTLPEERTKIQKEAMIC